MGADRNDINYHKRTNMENNFDYDINDKAYHKVFVYGTLKHGFHNHDVMSGRFLELATTASTFDMRTNGSYPTVTEDPNGHKIRGEVYICDGETMADLDRLEGNGSLYTRHVRGVTSEDGYTFPAWIYIYNGDAHGPATIDPQEFTHADQF